MAAADFLDRCAFRAAGGGTGTFTVSAALTGYLTPAAAGGIDATVYSYIAVSDDKSEWEFGTGTYTSSGTTLSRTPQASTNGGAAVDFTNPPQVAFGPRKEDLIRAALLTTRGDMIYRDANGPARLAKGSTGLVLQAGANDPAWGTLVAAAFATGPGIVTPAMMDNGTANSVLGRASNTGGARADIVAGTNDRLLGQASNALSFMQLTAGMVPNSLITFAMLASAAVATAGEILSGTASKLMSSSALASAAGYGTLTDAATITWDMNSSLNSLVALAGNRTLGNPSNPTPGYSFILKVTATTSTRTLTLSANFIVSAGCEAFPISITTSEKVYIVGFVDTSSRIIITGVVRT